MRFVLLLAAMFAAPAAWGAHAYAQFGDIKYPMGFAHFEWVNPNAPKGGALDLVPPLRITNFDKFNPFTLKGTAAPGMAGLVFETLLTGTMDEPTTVYGLLAEDVEVERDGLSITFRLNPAARFHDGKPVMAADVKHSFDKLMSKEAAPQYRVVYGDVKRAVVTGPRSVRFDLARASAELPLLVGGLPVFSRDWGAGKPLDQVIMDTPIASGPYRIGRMNFGRDITYERDPKYWGRELGVRRGMYNFDQVTYKIYKDNTAQTEAFKAGEFDYLRTFSAKEWARVYVGKKFDSGELVRVELPTRNAGDEWMNRRLMYNSYIRCNGWLNGSDFEAEGLPAGDELKVLEPLRKRLPARVFNQEVPLAPKTIPPDGLRGNLRKARDLLGPPAGLIARAPCATRKARPLRSSISTAAAASASSRPGSRRLRSSASRANTAAPTSR